eukprot:TRINITY_DN51270_c0_g1_i1.p1 TRINITY_DN51270_c0_g1~~TRINITY_DN51270_c0_g1_i1.p1  ORF type:complete len:291 (-),score=69.52 TRINITY_DN51270_c0_g1_i1:44-916(-)
MPSELSSSVRTSIMQVARPPQPPRLAESVLASSVLQQDSAGAAWGSKPRRLASSNSAFAGLCGLLCLPLVQRRRRLRAVSRLAANKEEWRQQWRDRCVETDGGCSTFDVTIPKPLGAELREFPDRDGVGVASILEDGNTWKLNQEVLTGSMGGMFVLEGDEVIAIDGTSCEGGGMGDVVPLIVESQGDAVTVRLRRSWLKTPKGPVKVMFSPSGKMASVTRGNRLEEIAQLAGEDVAFGCREGICKTCWHTEEATGTVWKICKDELPAIYDNVAPIILKPTGKDTTAPAA